MEPILIDFNDDIKREIDNNQNSITIKEIKFTAPNSSEYQIQLVIKKIGNQDVLHINLKNPRGNPVKDLQVKIEGKIIPIDLKTSQDYSVVIENIKDEPFSDLELSSKSENLKIPMTIFYEISSDFRNQKDLFFEKLLQVITPNKECLYSEKVIAFALDELEMSQKEEIQKHIYNCKTCFELAYDVILSKREAQENPSNPKTVLAELASNEIIDFKNSKNIIYFPTKIDRIWTIQPVAGMAGTLCFPIPRLFEKIQSATSFLKFLGRKNKIINFNDAKIIKSGNQFTINFELYSDAYILIFFQDIQRNLTKLFYGKVIANEPFRYDSKNNDITLAPESKTTSESIFIFVSKQSLDGFEEELKKLGKENNLDSIEKNFPEVYFLPIILKTK